MDEKQRKIKLRLSWFRHFAEKSHNVAQTCRYFGISRYIYYLWRRRYGKEGPAGLLDRSRRPQNSPRATPNEIVRLIIKLRKRKKLGPVLISGRLFKKYGFRLSPKTVYKILKARGLNKLRNTR